MGSYDFIQRITKPELFKLLRFKYSKSFESVKRSGNQSNFVIFKESIDILENYEKLLLMLKNDQEPTISQLQLFPDLVNSELDQLMSSLMYLRYIMSENEYLEIQAFRKISQYAGLIHPLDTSQPPVSTLNSYLGQQPLQLCTPHNVPFIKAFDRYEKDSFLALLEKLKPKVVEDSTFKGDQFLLSAEEEQYKFKFQRSLEEHQQIYVFCFDVSLYPINPQDGDDYEKLYFDKKSTIDRIVQEVSALSRLIHFLVRLEPSQKFGFNLHFVLMLSETKYFSEDTLIQKFENVLTGICLISMTKFVVRNWNDIVRKHLHNKAVGIIRKNDEAAINESWRWIFSAFFSTEQVIRFNLGYMPNLHCGDGPLAPNLSKLSLVNQSTPLSQAERDSNLHEKIFINRKHLAKPIQQYLSYADLIYSQYSFLPTNEGGDLLLSTLLGGVEVFCETLKVAKPELFIIPNKESFYSLSIEDLSTVRTRLGWMWLNLFKRLIEKPDFVSHRSVAKFCSQNVQVFFQFWEANRWEIEQLDSHIMGYYIQQLNQKISVLKEQLLDQKKLSLSSLESRSKDLIKYGNYLLSEDVYVLRIQVEFTISNQSLKQSDQSPILTEFLRVGQSAKPLCWIKGYLLRWDQYHCLERSSRQTYADLTLFLEDHPKMQSINLLEILQQYLLKFTSTYNEKKKLVNHANEIRVSIRNSEIYSPKPELRHNIIKIETVNKELRKSFVKYYLHSFCFLDLFILWDGVENGKKFKRYTTGQKPRPKQRCVKNKPHELS